MSAGSRPLDPVRVRPDAAVARYIAAIRAELEPDPLFARRLRGLVVNRYVAVREGAGVAPSTPATGEPREMTRIGRAVLYATFGLALSVTTAMGAAQQAVPGDVLYAFKLQVEELRRDVLPARFQDELTAIELAERLDEMARLSERQEPARAAELLDVIRTEYSLFASELVDPADPEALEAHQIVIDALVEQLPVPAEQAVEEVITEVDASLEVEPALVVPDGNPGGVMNDGTNPNGSTNQGGANNDGTPGKAGDRGSSADRPAPEREPQSRPDPSSGD